MHECGILEVILHICTFGNRQPKTEICICFVIHGDFNHCNFKIKLIIFCDFSFALFWFGFFFNKIFGVTLEKQTHMPLKIQMPLKIHMTSA